MDNSLLVDRTLDTGNNSVDGGWVMQKILIQFLPLPFIAKVIRLCPQSAF